MRDRLEAESQTDELSEWQIVALDLCFILSEMGIALISWLRVRNA